MSDFIEGFKIVMSFVLIVSLFVFAVGAGFSIWGFWTYRKYRLLAVTAEARIRGVALGLVEIHGKATGQTLFPSPMSGAPCVFYKFQIVCCGKKGGDWMFSETKGESFYLQDETGKIKVFPLLAKLEVPTTSRVITMHRQEEGKIEQSPEDAKLADLIRSTLRNHDLARLAAVRAEIAKISDPFARRLLDPGNTPQEHTGPHLVTETCIFADASYDVTGTCVVNPHPEDSGDHYLIVKGTQEATFVISSRAERATEELLRLRARHYISLGFRIMVITLALIVAAVYAQTLP